MVGFAGSYSHSAGDVFVFKGGVTWPSAVFNLSIANSGADGNPDIYIGGQRQGTPWGSGYPVFDGGAVNGRLCIWGAGESYITIDGIKIINCGYTDASGQAINFPGGSGITVKNCWLQPNSINAFAYSTTSGNYSAVYFHDNIIKQAGRLHVTVGDATCDDFQFYNNTMYGAIDYDSQTYHKDGFMIGADGDGSYKATNLKIYNNKFLGDWSQGATAMIYVNGTPNTYKSWQNVYVYNNQCVIENNTGTALSPALGVYVIQCDNLNIWNNTIDGRALDVHNGTGIFLGYENNNVDIRNNIICGMDNAIIFQAGTTGDITIGNNLFYDNTHLLWDVVTSNRYDTCAAIPEGYKGTYCSVSDPEFVTLPSGGVVDSGNWHIQASSPAIGEGIDFSGTFTTDIDGKIRGSSWDIGAYQQYTTTNPTAPQPPTNLRVFP